MNLYFYYLFFAGQTAGNSTRTRQYLKGKQFAQFLISRTPVSVLIYIDRQLQISLFHVIFRIILSVYVPGLIKKWSSSTVELSKAYLKNYNSYRLKTQ
jgi:hypothetical protein